VKYEEGVSIHQHNFMRQNEVFQPQFRNKYMAITPMSKEGMAITSLKQKELVESFLCRQYL
jgi:hypothetical protein